MFILNGPVQVYRRRVGERVSVLNYTSFVELEILLAHLSRRLRDELLVYQ